MTSLIQCAAMLIAILSSGDGNEEADRRLLLSYQEREDDESNWSFGPRPAGLHSLIFHAGYLLIYRSKLEEELTPTGFYKGLDVDFEIKRLDVNVARLGGGGDLGWFRWILWGFYGEGVYRGESFLNSGGSSTPIGDEGGEVNERVSMMGFGASAFLPLATYNSFLTEISFLIGAEYRIHFVNYRFPSGPRLWESQTLHSAAPLFAVQATYVIVKGVSWSANVDAGYDFLDLQGFRFSAEVGVRIVL